MSTLQHRSRYETETVLEQYLLFHYGSDEDLLPFPFGPKDSLHFPVRCVTESLDIPAIALNAQALDLGCSVGRSSYELARLCDHVLAVDSSHAFISAAKEIQQAGHLNYAIQEEGLRKVPRIAKRPEDVDPSRIEFRCSDVMDLFKEPATFDVVLLANLLCRLPDPLTFLIKLPLLVAPAGQLVITSPYTWLEEFTPRDHWLGMGEKSTLALIQEVLEDAFYFQRAFDLPFLIREHLRSYQWGVSQASVWIRKS
jgi:putative 4-mercaptohistidine N1-methyltranferase